MKRRLPVTFYLGLLIILTCEFLLFTDVRLSHRGPLHTDAEIQRVLDQEAIGALARAARFAAVNMTALAWLGYIVMLDGLLTFQQRRGFIRSRKHHFATLCLASIVIWCVFDWINFYYIHAWNYIGMPPIFLDTVPGYLLAFGAIVPGMLMTGQVLLNFGLFNWAVTPKWTMPKWGLALSLIAGIGMFAWPLLAKDPVTNLTLWTSFVFLLDPINYALRRPSMFRDWENGWLGRTLAAFAGGLLCGFLWEFWNYWALAKWVYHLPFLGSIEHIRYFEMPAMGLIGFLPFGIECWIMWQLMRIPLDGMVEEIPNDRSLL